MNNLEDALKRFLENNPDLPAGPEESPEEDDRGGIARQQLTVSIERKGRAGKTATIISGFTLSETEVGEIASLLKTRLGVGGSSRSSEILIQGDRRADAARILRDMGHRVKGI